MVEGRFYVVGWDAPSGDPKAAYYDVNAASWTDISSGYPIVHGGPDCIHGSSFDNVWVGDYSTPYPTLAHWNGSSWTKHEITAEASGTWFVGGVFAFSSTDVYAFGGRNTQWSYEECYLWHFNGSAWSRVTLIPAYALYCLWGTSGNDLYMGGYKDVAGTEYFLIHWNGSTPTYTLSDPDGWYYFYGVWGSASDNVFALYSNFSGDPDTKLVQGSVGAGWTMRHNYEYGPITYGTLIANSTGTAWYPREEDVAPGDELIYKFETGGAPTEFYRGAVDAHSIAIVNEGQYVLSVRGSTGDSALWNGSSWSDFPPPTWFDQMDRAIGITEMPPPASIKMNWRKDMGNVPSPGNFYSYQRGMSYDAVQQRIYMWLKGTYTGSPGLPTDELWSTDGYGWTQQITQGPQPPYANGAGLKSFTLGGHNMVYDSVRNVHVLYGGRSQSTVDDDDGRIHELDTSTNPPTWTRKGPFGFGGTHPGRQYQFAMAFDGTETVIVCPAGYGSGPGAGVYSWDGTSWTHVSSTPTFTGAVMAYDETAGNIVLFGTDGTTWTGDRTGFTQQFPANSPPARSYAGMAYHAGVYGVIMFGGIDAESGDWVLADCWRWDGAAGEWYRIWHRQELFPNAGVRGHRMAWLPEASRIISFGGEGT